MERDRPEPSPPEGGPSHLALLLLALPALWVLLARGAAFGSFSVDLAGHLWTSWAVGRDGLLRTGVIGWPEGYDMLPALGGWLDVALVALLRCVLPLELSYDLVVAGYVVVAGLGGWLLARNLGASSGAALVAGLLLQLDGFVLQHLTGGRPELVALGFMALFLGLAHRAWRGRCPNAPWLAGLAGALLLLASWELSLLAGLVLVVLLPFQLWSSRPPGLGERLRGMVLVGGLIALPWVGLFLARASRVRGLDEGAFWLQTASHASVGLLGWFGPGTARPGWLLLLALLALPLTLRQRHRMLGFGVLLGLALSLALALGPHPALWSPGPGQAASWGPFALLQGLPVLGWFHWPDRLLAVWSLAAVIAAALAVDALGRRRRWLGVLVACLLLADAGIEAGLAGRWPRGRYRIPAHAGAEQLAALAGAGAVLDLPPQPNPVNHLHYQLIQIRHGRPIRHHHHLRHLLEPGVDDGVDQQAVLSWFHALMQGGAPERGPFEVAELAQLRSAGFGFVVLHQPGWPPQRWARARDLLLESLGEPVIQQGQTWICWRLPGVGEGES
jgi:hypothetical protein